MQKELIAFYKEINGGKIRGARKIIADALEIDETAVSKWNSGENKPSEENIEKISKIFNKSEEEIKKIFNLNLKALKYKNQSDIDFYKKELSIKNDLLEILKNEIISVRKENKEFRDKIKILEKELRKTK